MILTDEQDKQGLETVTQADRDAAAVWIREDYGDAPWADDVQSGEMPSNLAQAFARHRTEATRNRDHAFEAMLEALEYIQAHGLTNAAVPMIRKAAALARGDQ